MSRTHRIVSIAAALLLLVGLSGLVNAIRWIDTPFPGFLVLRNGVVASAGLPDWEATRDGAIYQHQVVAVDGTPIRDVDDLGARVEAAGVGASLTYTFRRGNHELQRTIAVQNFGLKDSLLLFGLYLLNGALLGGAAVMILLRTRAGSASPALPFLLLGAFWGLSAMDLYGPYTLFRVHAFCESLLCAAALHMAVGFTDRANSDAARRLIQGGYVLAGCLAVAYQLGLDRPDVYVWTHLAATSLGGAALCGFLVTLVWENSRSHSAATQRTLRILLFGAAVSLAPAVVLSLPALVTGGQLPQNSVGLTVFLFPLAIAYAAWRGAPAAAPGVLSASRAV